MAFSTHQAGLCLIRNGVLGGREVQRKREKFVANLILILHHADFHARGTNGWLAWQIVIVIIIIVVVTMPVLMQRDRTMRRHYVMIFT